MRIALLTDTFKVGGGLEHIYQIAKSIPDYEFFVFAKSGYAKDKFEALANVSLVPLGYAPSLVLKYKPDIIHIHHLKPLFRFYRIKHVAFYEIPIVFTVHGMHIHKYEFLENSLSNKLRFNLRFALERYLFNKTNKVICVSMEDKKFIMENYNIGEEKIEYVTNGIDFTHIDDVTEPKEELRKKLNLPLDKCLFLTAARFDFQKGYDILLKAIKILKADYNTKDLMFVFVGDGDTLDESKAFAAENNLNDIVSFQGRKNNVYEFMKASDCFILPSRWEGLPITIIEAGASKLPVIASDTYGNREIIEHEQNGILFKNLDSADLAEKIAKAAPDCHKLSHYGYALREKVKRDYNIDLMIEKLKKVYKKLD